MNEAEIGQFSNLAQKINQISIIVFQSFFVTFPCLHDLEKLRHYQFDWVCTSYLEYKSLVLKNVRITGI